jgi:outer membrane protein insertion porin family
MAAEAVGQVTDRVVQRWLREKPPISTIVVEGNEYFSDDEIIDRMYSRLRNTWSALKGDRRTRVRRETLGRDTLEITYLYITNGFLDVDVDESFEMVDAGSSARIRVRITEGKQLRYGGKTVSGSYDSTLHEQFVTIAEDLKEDDPVSIFGLRGASFKMKSILANNGYPYAEVDFTLDSSDASSVVPIGFHIIADSLVHLGNVTALGSSRYPVKVVYRESRMNPDDIYRRQDIIDTRRRLIESGYFTTLSIDQVDSSANRYRPDFELRVVERKPMYTSFKTGVGRSNDTDFEWDVSGAFGKRNFLGSRRYDLYALLKIGVGGQSGLLQQTYRVRYTEPWFFKVRMPLVLTAEWKPLAKDLTLDYWIESRSLSASTIKQFSKVYQGEFGIEYESVRIDSIPEDQIEELGAREGVYGRHNLYLGFRRDSRDHIFVPRRGSLTDVTAALYGGFLGGDDNFTKFEASWSTYRVVWPGWISATRLKGGSARAFNGSDDVPIEDRFLQGGANSIRGFNVNSLGPQTADGDPYGADFYGLFNQEFRWETFPVFKAIPILKHVLGVWPLWQSLFFDMGNGFRSMDQASWRGLAYSYGTGIQIVSPAGPIRIDYAQRIPTETIEAGGQWHFTLLYAF